MHAAAVLFLSVVALAGRVLALTIDVGGNLGNITATQFLMVNDTQLMTACTSQCQPGMSAIQSCGASDTCLCNATTVAAVRTCQQCYFTNIIAENRKMPNVLAGSTPALAAYSAACLAPPTNVTIAATAIALTLPDNWDGPVAMHLSTGATIIYLVSVLTIGVGLMSVVITM